MALLVPNPLTLPIIGANTERNIRIGWHPDMRVNVYKADAPGTHACVIFAHGGGGSSREQTTLFESSAEKTSILGRCFNNPAIYGIDDFPIDVVSVRYPMVVRDAAKLPWAAAPTGSAYEATIEGTASGHGPVSLPGYGPLIMETIQLAIQWAGDNAAAYGWDSNMIGFWGQSIGLVAGAAASYGPPRQQSTAGHQIGRFDYTSTSRPKAILNWFGPGSVNPNKLHYQWGSVYSGIAESVQANLQADMNRAMLYPDSAGVYQLDAAERSLCKFLSPLSRIAMNLPENRNVPMLSYYWEDELEMTPGTGYSTSPPYLQPHDPRWFDEMQAACDAAGIFHDGARLDDADFAGGILEMWESTVVPTKDFFKARMAY